MGVSDHLVGIPKVNEEYLFCSTILLVDVIKREEVVYAVG